MTGKACLVRRFLVYDDVCNEDVSAATDDDSDLLDLCWCLADSNAELLSVKSS